MATLAERLQGDLNGARKSGERDRTLLLSTILADVKNRRIELRRDPTDDEVVDVLRRGIKRRRESAEMYEKGARPELAAREREEAATLETYLPAQVGEDEIRAAVREAIAGGATAMGPLMGAVNPRFKGRADGGVVSRIAREELAARA